VVFSDKPADKDHPYGHGKIEHFSAAFEGGLITLAAVLIAYEAIDAMWHGPALKDVGRGLVFNFAAGLLNGLLGLFLVRMGRRQRSRAIEADGHHVLSDFYTTLGIAAGLLLVTFTGVRWLDPVMALGVATLLGWTGFKLVRSSSQALLDMEDPVLLEKLLEVINRTRPVDIITLHELRTLRSGRYTHVDIHMVVPEYYELGRAHDLAEDFGKRIIVEASLEGELHTHIDPCQRAWCSQCGVADCRIRQEPQTKRVPITLDAATEAGSI
jgi:cation diffusion facilitator family transporter